MSLATMSRALRNKLGWTYKRRRWVPPSETKGREGIGKVPKNWDENVTLISSMNLGGMGASMSMEGSADGEALIRSRKPCYNAANCDGRQWVGRAATLTVR